MGGMEHMDGGIGKYQLGWGIWHGFWNGWDVGTKEGVL